MDWSEHSIVYLLLSSLSSLSACLSLRLHPHRRECDRGDGEGGRLGVGGAGTWCPISQAPGNQAAVNL